jgi:PEGA domain
MIRAAVWLIAASALTLGWLQPLAAQPLTGSLSGQAAADYNSGRLLFDDQDYAGASLKFQRAYDQSRDPRLLWNVAASEKNLRHYANVLRLLERYIAEAQTSMPPAQRRDVDDVIETVRLLISTVRLTVDQAGVTISIDGVAAGSTPLLEPLRVDLGRRELLLRKPGWKDQRLVQEFAGGSEVSLNVQMQPEDKDGRVNVFAARGQSIRIDGRIVGEGQWSGSLPQGEHLLRVTAEDMRPHEQEISIVAGQTRTLHVALERAESGVSAWVWIGAGSALVVAGLVTGGYFLFRPAHEAEPVEGSLGAAVDL